MEHGDLVKLTHPQDEAERNARYILIEDRGDRALIEYVCTMSIRPTECVPMTEIEPAE